MDNFTIWVDAPTEALIETPMDDESSCFLRDEILQTQQYVIEKLDEQKTTEQEKGDHSIEATAAAEKITSRISAEGKRTKEVYRELVDFRESCKVNELKLVAIKKDFPATIGPLEDNHEKVLSEVNREIFVLQESYAFREKAIQKLLQINPNESKEAAKKGCKKLREIVSEAKKKHDQLKDLRVSRKQLLAEYEQALASFQKDKESLESEKNAQKELEDQVEQITEECVNLRSQLIQLEATQSKNSDNADQKEIASLQEKANKIRQETAQLTTKLGQIKKETDDAQVELDANKKEELENNELITKRKKEIVALLKKKISEAKKKMVKGTKQKKLLELHNAINKETAALEKAKKDLESSNPDGKTLDELKNEVSSLGSEIRNYEKQIKEATKENDQLVKEIQVLRSASSEETPPNSEMNDTAEFIESDYSTQVAAPQLSLELTPIQRHLSRDAFTGAPLMTSTPLHKVSETARTTRAAARRLEKSAAAKTAEIRRKRGGKK